jgi:hypothetical protein
MYRTNTPVAVSRRGNFAGRGDLTFESQHYGAKTNNPDKSCTNVLNSINHSSTVSFPSHIARKKHPRPINDSRELVRIAVHSHDFPWLACFRLGYGQGREPEPQRKKPRRLEHLVYERKRERHTHCTKGGGNDTRTARSLVSRNWR